MAKTNPEIQAALRSMPALIKLISEDATLKVKLSPTGELCVLQDRRWKIIETDISSADVRGLASVILEYDNRVDLGPWWFRAMRSGSGWTIFGERHAKMATSNLDNSVREALLEQAKRGGMTLFVGPPDSGKTSMMLWLASQLGRKSMVFVSELAPETLPGPSATHIYPPTHPGERRDLERILRAHDCIFWDRLSNPADLSTLIDTPGVHNRWVSMDAENPAEALLRLDYLSFGRLPVDFETFAVTGFDENREPCLLNLLCFERGEWREYFALSKSVKSLLQNQPQATDDTGTAPDKSADEAEPPAAQSDVARHGMDVKELLQTDTIEREALFRASGEIDLQSFVKAREARRRALEEEAERESEAFVDSDDGEEPVTEIASGPQDVEEPTSQVSGERVNEILSDMMPDDELPPELADFDQSQLTQPSNDEITALTPVELESIRASAEEDEVSNLLDSDDYRFDSDDNASVLDGDSVASVLSGESSYVEEGVDSGAYDVPDSRAPAGSGPHRSAPEESGPHASSSPYESGPHTNSADRDFQERTKSGRHKIVRRSQSEASSVESDDDQSKSGERVIPTSWGSDDGSASSAHDDETDDDLTEELRNVEEILGNTDDSS